MSYIDLPLKFTKAGTRTYAYRKAGPTANSIFTLTPGT